ncbi:MAG: glycoside hydrolase family 13 protein [Ruminococcaceae bacterium]|nr:glycoside hydrolase family 13 protein [Oscillospiraceae bacterium]
MQYYPFDSRKSLYKSKFSAVKSGESLTLRLLLHKDAKADEAFLLLSKDGEDEQKIPLTQRESLEDYIFYDTEISPSGGLYWYRFFYTSPFGNYFVTKVNGVGIVNLEPIGASWQLTVYDSDFTTPDWIKGGIIYQIFPDRFYDSGKAKKNVPSDRFIVKDKKKQPTFTQDFSTNDFLGNDYYCGDLEGVRLKLPYLKGLGVNCIYLNPIFEAHSNHRYNTADYMKIDPLLGDEKDFIRLCKDAKKQGIHIILDGVFSHTGDDSIYFNKKNRYSGIGAYNSENSKYHGWFKFKNWPDDYEAWWGVPTLPETVEENENFLEFITSKNGVIRHWLRLGADGWRLDVADELPDVFLDSVRTAIKQEKKDAFLLGEVWEDATNKVSYNARRRFLRGKQLDSVMNYPFANSIVDFVMGGNGEAFISSILDIIENYPPCSLHTLMNHIGTHDTARILTRLGFEGQVLADRNWQAEQRLSKEQQEIGKKRLKLAAVLQYTLPGVPSLYYGDEIGTEGFGDPFCRGFFDWENGDKALTEFYKKLGKFRRENSVFKDGEFIPLHFENGCMAYLRKRDKDFVFVGVNTSDAEREIEIPKNLSNEKIKIGPNDFCLFSGKIK